MILVEIVDSLHIEQKFWSISIIVKIFKNLHFRKSWFLSAFREIISILVKIFEHLDFG